MKSALLTAIEDFQLQHGMTDYQIGFSAARNGRLIERLRAGGRVWPETEEKIRSWLALRAARHSQHTPEIACAESIVTIQRN